MPRHLILGTAGHVDHGKTALIKALTGIDCDTHKEEKRRGITINLGFACLKTDSGTQLGIVDVPGHRDFVHTMISGASGIDLVLLIIAADEGIMPQTREHLQIMQVLGVKNGLIALTKQDLVDPQTLTSRIDTVTSFVRGTFLEGKPIVPVSALTGSGIPALIQAIVTESGRTDERPADGVFRMFIDRIFSVSGFGTVVTGSVLGGSVRCEDALYLLPGSKTLRVRRIERYGEAVESVSGGERASLNLAGLDKADFKRGMLLSDSPLKSTGMLDARLTLFAHSRGFALWTSADFLLGTYEAQCRIHLIDRDRCEPGDSAIVQIHLPHPCVARIGDRFVIRDTSAERTLGGGEVIDAAPLHHRRRPRELVFALQRIEQGMAPELVKAEARKHTVPCPSTHIAAAINASPEEVESILTALSGREIVTYRHAGILYAADPAVIKRLQARIVEKLASHHRSHPLDERGLTLEDLLGKVGMARETNGSPALRGFLHLLAEQHVIRHHANTFALASHRVAVDRRGEEEIRCVESILEKAGMQAPLMVEIVREAKQHKLDETRINQILRFLTTQGRAYAVEGTFLHASIVDKCRIRLLRYLTTHPEGATVAQFRDLVQGNRKICLMMLAIFDKQGVTQRREDVRVITEEGRRVIEAEGETR